MIAGTTEPLSAAEFETITQGNGEQEAAKVTSQVIRVIDGESPP
jgi:hypothetical protein